jgi:hypothetical protein
MNIGSKLVLNNNNNNNNNNNTMILTATETPSTKWDQN